MTITTLAGRPVAIGDQVTDLVGKEWTLTGVTDQGMVLLEGNDTPLHPEVVGLVVTT